jgi:hypothetical protein
MDEGPRPRLMDFERPESSELTSEPGQARRAEIGKPRAKPWGLRPNTNTKALKGRDSPRFTDIIPPFQGSAVVTLSFPRASPWAVVSRPFGAQVP